MGIATPTPTPHPILSHHHASSANKSSISLLIQMAAPGYSAAKSMSQDYNADGCSGVFSFPGNGFERSGDQDQQQHHVAQQIRQDKLRLQMFEPMVGIEEENANLPVYETAGMLSEMFFPPGGGGGSAGTAVGELLDHSMIVAHTGFRAQRPPPLHPPTQPGIDGDWYSKSQSGNHNMSSMNADPAAAMQLFLTNPQTRSPSPPQQQPGPASSTLHMLLPNPNPSSSLQGFSVSSVTAGGYTGGAAMIGTPPPPPQQQFAFEDGSSNAEIGGFVEGKGLSLSLSTSLQHLEAAKANELRNMGSDGLLFYNQGASNSPSLSSTQCPYKHGQNHPVHIGYAPSLGVVNVLRNSRYLKAAQELLEEFCSVGRGHFRKAKLSRSANPNSSSNPSSGSNNNNNKNNGGGASSSSTSKENPPLSVADRMEHQRRKVKLLSMLDEVDRRYNHYCEQMQMVVNSFDLVMGFGAAVPYTALAQKAMSRHFRCLKDAIAAQLKHSCELLGEKDGAGTSGITKGETPRLKILDQSLRQQRAFHQMGMMEQEAWRPQRGLPERSVNILRAWLFEHFLHPYPSDADKHLLARQTGLSRNQVSNWFINARVRLWKPMVEEMYQQEAKDEEGNFDNERDKNPRSSATADADADSSRRPDTSIGDSDHSLPSPASRHSMSETPLPNNNNNNNNNNRQYPPSSAAVATSPSGTAIAAEAAPSAFLPGPDPGHFNQRMTVDEACRPGGSFASDYGAAANMDMAPATLIGFGTTAGDVSLTLGLRHAGNMPDKNSFSITEFGGC